ncbi:MAG: FAD:protein FMN transferase [Bacteroidales bacterium]|nr:FAD:protein FMN transferase [Bacteroidales bacterium]
MTTVNNNKFRKTAVQLVLFVLIILLVCIFTLTGKKGEYIRLAGFAQGTTYHVTYESKKGENLQNQIDSILADFDMSLSIYQPGSVISRLNRNEPGTRVDQKFKAVFTKSIEVYEKTNGAFDITVGPIVNALGFGNADTITVDSTIIDSLLLYVGMDKISLRDDILEKKHEGIVLDVNAIAQGYSVDVVADFMEALSIKNYMVEIGGEVRAKGKNDRNQFWQIGIDKPQEGNMLPGSDLQAIISLRNRSLATSGNYRKFYEKDGIKFVHTVNPKTGYPVISNLLSATVVSDDCMTADAYATAFMVFGLDRSMAFLEENNFLDAYLIYADQEGKFRVFATQGLQKYVEE